MTLSISSRAQVSADIQSQAKTSNAWLCHSKTPCVSPEWFSEEHVPHAMWLP